MLEMSKNNDELFVRPPRFGHGGHMTFAVLKDLDDIEINQEDFKGDNISIYNNGSKMDLDNMIDRLIEGVKGLEYISKQL